MTTKGVVTILYVVRNGVIAWLSATGVRGSCVGTGVFAWERLEPRRIS